MFLKKTSKIKILYERKNRKKLNFVYCFEIQKKKCQNYGIFFIDYNQYIFKIFKNEDDSIGKITA